MVSIMFNGPLAQEMADYIELRTAVVSASSVSNDKSVLLLLDQYLIQIGFQGKELTEDVLSEWAKTLSGKSKTVKEKLGVVRGFFVAGIRLCKQGCDCFFAQIINGFCFFRSFAKSSSCSNAVR